MVFADHQCSYRHTALSASVVLIDSLIQLYFTQRMCPMVNQIWRTVTAISCCNASGRSVSSRHTFSGYGRGWGGGGVSAHVQCYPRTTV